MALIGKTVKGYWPAAVGGKIPGDGDQVVGYPSHPYAMKMNSEYFLRAGRHFEQRYGVAVPGHPRRAPVKDPRERLVQFKTNMDVAMSVLDRNGLGDWLADRLVEIGDTLRDVIPTRTAVAADPFQQYVEIFLLLVYLTRRIAAPARRAAHAPRRWRGGQAPICGSCRRPWATPRSPSPPHLAPCSDDELDHVASALDALDGRGQTFRKQTSDN